MPGATATIRAAIAEERELLLRHEVYEVVRGLPGLRVFMRSHVFAVWDFMSLVKSLQQSVTCVEVPWMPKADARAARVIQQIVLAEECDELDDGRITSHFELYLTAMNEVGGDTQLVRRFVAALERGGPVGDALASSGASKAVQEFVGGTLEVARHGAPHEVAASFLLGREDLIPEMFLRLAREIEASGSTCPSFITYLSRHIDLDAAEHAPLAAQLLDGLCGEDPQRVADATAAAREAVRLRCRLWDGIVDEVGTSARLAGGGGSVDACAP